MLRCKVGLVLFLGMAVVLKAQFIDNSKNTIRNAENLSGFYEKLANAKQGQGSLRILHIGDSHIQAGFFTGTLREAFQRDFGNAGRGLVFPYRLARTNGDVKVRFSSNVAWQRYRIITDDAPNAGIAGATVYTNAPQFRLKLRCDETNSFNQVEIFGEGLEQVKLAILKEKNTELQPQMTKEFHKVRKGDVLGKIARKYAVTVKQLRIWNNLKSTLIRIGQKLIIHKESKIPAFSAEKFQWVAPFEQSGTTLKAILNESLTEIYLVKEGQEPNETVKLYSVHLRNGQQGITYDAVGYNGAKYTDYLDSPRFFEQLEQQEQPDLIIISLGTNEAFDKVYQLESFREDVTQFCKDVQQRTGCTNILLTTPPSALQNRKYPPKKLPAYSEILQEIAQENHYAVWDLYEVMGGKDGIRNWYRKGLASKDRVHFTESGYNLQGESLYQALMNAAE